MKFMTCLLQLFSFKKPVIQSSVDRLELLLETKFKVLSLDDKRDRNVMTAFT